MQMVKFLANEAAIFGEVAACNPCLVPVQMVTKNLFYACFRHTIKLIITDQLI
jgi:hypothetical protein